MTSCGLERRLIWHLADHRKAFTRCQGPGRKGVAEIVRRGFRRTGIQIGWSREGAKSNDEVVESQPWSGV